MYNVDMVLVVPPYLGELSPMMGVSVLQACLNRVGISSWVDYENDYFLDMFPQMAAIYSTGIFDIVPEYVFNGIAGIRNSVTTEEILELIVRNAHHSLKGKEAKREQLNDYLAKAIECAGRWVEDATERILDRNPKVVGCSSIFTQRNATLGLLKRIKERRPDIITAIGGYNVSDRAGIATLRKFDFVDCIFYGESDDIFAEAVQKLINGDTDRLPEGILWRGDDYPEESLYHVVRNLDVVPVPCYDDFFEFLKTDAARRIEEKFAGSGHETFIPMESSRGCWWGEKHPCTFCGVCGGGLSFRRKSPDLYIAQIREMEKKYEKPLFILTDPVLPYESLNDVVDTLIQDKGSGTFFSEVKSNLSKADIQKLAQAGYVKLQPGIESFSDHFLKVISKGVTACQNVAFLKNCKEAGVEALWNIITGGPDENIDDLKSQQELLPKIMHLKAPTGYSEILYARDSQYQLHPEKFGLKLVPKKEYRFMCPEDDEYIADIAVYYDNANETSASEEIQTARKELYDLCDDWIYGTDKISQVLDMAVQSSCVMIVDTRRCRKNVYYNLKGVKKDVYLLADGPVDEKSIIGKLVDRYDENEIRAALKELTEENLMVFLSGKYLSLAVRIDSGTFLTKYFFSVV